MNLSELKKKSAAEVFEMAQAMGIESISRTRKQDIIFALLKANAANNVDIHGDGVLEILQDGFGFWRSDDSSYLAGADDIYVSPSQIRRFGLRTGDTVSGKIRPPKDNERYFALLKVDTINFEPPESARNKIAFENLTPLHADKRMRMERGNGSREDITARVIDIVAPYGKGQRGLILSPPKAGKTTLLHHFAQATLQNNPEIQVFVLLVDERPEEVTTFRRSLPGAVVFSSSSDEERNNHLRLTRLAMNIAMRAMESGQDVMVLIDSLTRMSRAYNLEAPNNSKIMSGGVSAGALDLPRRLFGSARNIENGGSLTILASILVDTGSRMDEVIFQEFKGTGNLDLVLSREAAESRLFPAIDLKKSGTRRDDLLLSHETLKIIAKHRILLAERTATEAVRFTLNWLRDSKELP